MQSESFLLLFSLLLKVPVCWTSSTCMAKCTDELTQPPHSLYEQYCCNDNNTGKSFKIRENNVLKIIFCPDNSPISCESGIASGVAGDVLYGNDPLWDGQQCGGLEGPCCTNSKMPWFIKTLNENTNEDIELRVMVDEDTSNEDISLDIIELYIR